VRTNEVVKLMGGERIRETGEVCNDREGAVKAACEKNGVSVEGEFVFSRAVGEFLREEVRMGSFRGNYMLNLKEQMKMRCLRENGDDRRLRVLLVGASQVGRIGAEMGKIQSEKVRIVGQVRMGDEHTEEKHEEIVEGVRRKMDEVDVVVVGGPSNSQVRHGKEGERGFESEIQVRIVRNREGDDEWHITYHMTDQVKIPMTEKVELVDRMVELMADVKKMVGEEVRVIH
jgi:hypothetical protein